MTRIKRSILCLALTALLQPVAGRAAQPSSAEAEVAFAYGVKAFNHGELDEAVRLFREAVAADPEDGTARYWLGLALLRQGKHREAAEEIEASLEARRPPAVERSQVEADLRRAQAGETEAVVAPVYGLELLAVRDRPRFDLRVGGFLGSDSNPALVPAGGIATLPGGTVLFGETKDDVLSLDLRAAYYPFYDRGGLSFGLTGEYAAARFSDLDFLDQTRWRAAAHLAWGNDPLGYLTGPLGYTRVPFGQGRAAVLLQVGTAESRLDGDALLQSHEAALTVVGRVTRELAAQVEASFAKRDYQDGSVEADAWSVAPSLIFYLGRRERSLRLGTLWSEEDDLETTSLWAELSVPLSEKLVLQLLASRSVDEKSAPAGFEDTTLRAGGGLTWAVTRNLFVIGRAGQTDRNSNRDDREYDRATFSLGVLWMR